MEEPESASGIFDKILTRSAGPTGELCPYANRLRTCLESNLRPTRSQIPQGIVNSRLTVSPWPRSHSVTGADISFSNLKSSALGRVCILNRIHYLAAGWDNNHNSKRV